MTISTRRLSYVYRNMTQTLISRKTGIPQSTISRVLNNQIKLPKKYRSSLRNLYQKQAYAGLRSFGASSTQARRFSWYIPETVMDVENTLYDTKNMLKTSWVAQQSFRADHVLSSHELDILEKEAEDQILATMRKSKKSIEQIYESGHKKIFYEI